MLDRRDFSPQPSDQNSANTAVTKSAFGAAKAPFSYLEGPRNCSRLATAERAAVLVDAADYFCHLRQAIRAAERSILIVGWDFDARIRLCPVDEDQTLGELLRSCVDEKPNLEVRVLVWSLGVMHGPGAAMPMLTGEAWSDHPRIQVRLDTKHPIYGAQHQKIVCVDDALAFVGGIDLTVDRWDTPEHLPDDPRRTTPDGASYHPVHDVQIAIDGDAACAVADVARLRWTCATEEQLEPLRENVAIWPNDLTPEFEHVPVGVACTLTEWSNNRPERAVAALTNDVIARAKRTLYIETQYLTAKNVERQLKARLAEPDGPEIVILETEAPPGKLERFVMGNNSDRLLRRLKSCDRHDRLRVYHPVTAGAEGEVEVKVHAKLMIADDDLVKIGSSNLNNRSMGVDSECDVAIEARDDHTRAAIARLRDRLLAEHLGATVDTVATAVQREDSLIRAIERLNRGPRRLQPMRALLRDGPRRPLPFTWLLDPPRPLALGATIRRRWRSLIAKLPSMGSRGRAEEAQKSQKSYRR